MIYKNFSKNNGVISGMELKEKQCSKNLGKKMQCLKQDVLVLICFSKMIRGIRMYLFQDGVAFCCL